ncbi:HNH endonuclease signature motif containing protein [Pectobacterium odoriferum]|uniref:HNH endonuclease signature motif containing protein n=1 Tax=Pectobacterium odoriferum TaxID=78398 RepID=UPI0032EE7495
MVFKIGNSYSFQEAMELYKRDNTNCPGLTQGGFLNPAKGSSSTLIRAIFAREDINGPLPNFLFISGDNENRNYFSRMKKIMEEEKGFLYFNKVGDSWIYRGESQIIRLLEPSSFEAMEALNEEGYRLEVVGYKNNEPYWQLIKDDRYLFEKPRIIEFVAAVNLQSSPSLFNKTEDIVIGRVREAIIRIRLDQKLFSTSVSKLYKNKCIITHAPKIKESLYVQACHISNEKDSDYNFLDNSSNNGVLLRADLHALFDKGLLTIDAKTGIVTFASKELQLFYSEYHKKQCKSWELVPSKARENISKINI